jgi:hypothetical protein
MWKEIQRDLGRTHVPKEGEAKEDCEDLIPVCRPVAPHGCLGQASRCITGVSLVLPLVATSGGTDSTTPGQVVATILLFCVGWEIGAAMPVHPWGLGPPVQAGKKRRNQHGCLEKRVGCDKTGQ